jgi:chitin disaccharide deacetylase
MKFCIVNADDFGMSAGINQGILEAHLDGIVTSTSVMVNMPHSLEAADLSERSSLSLGLHVNFTGESADPIAALAAPRDWRSELEAQLDTFVTLTGRLPTHLDSHQNVHFDPRLLPYFLEIADRLGIPLRGRSQVRYYPHFYGQWDGESHPEQVSAGNLIKMLTEDFQAGITELSCHPGHPEPDLKSFYSVERDWERRTLCSPEVRRAISELHIRLIGFQDLADVINPPVAGVAPWH